MITPRFQIKQDDHFLTINIRAPYCDIKDLDIHIEDSTFIFYSKPYFLRLNLPKPIKDSNVGNSKFDADTQEFIFQIEKAVPKEFFPDLDMLTKLLQPVPCKQSKHEIEVLSSTENEDQNEDVTDESDQWFIEQNLQKLKISENECADSAYGFGNKIKDTFEISQFEMSGILDDISTVSMNRKDRKEARVKYENEKFDADYYVTDYLDTDSINELCRFQSPWKAISEAEFTDDELDILKDFPNREYLLNVKEENTAYLGLIDILYAYCFEKRSFMFENTVESGWAINKISSTLSWFDSFSDPKDVITACIRRSLIFPLYRNTMLSFKVLEDLKLVLKLGKRLILKCLLEIYTLFNSGSSQEPRCILNELYLKDYCIFIQKGDFSKLEVICNSIEKLTISKDELDLNLMEIEAKSMQLILGEESSEEEDSDDTDESSEDSDDTDESSEDSDDIDESSEDSDDTDGESKNSDLYLTIPK